MQNIEAILQRKLALVENHDGLVFGVTQEIEKMYKHGFLYSTAEKDQKLSGNKYDAIPFRKFVH